MQDEAARLFQDWAADSGPDDREKWDDRHRGGGKRQKAGRQNACGAGIGLAEKLKPSLQNKPNPEYEQKYLDAGYNVADCWLKYAKRNRRLANARSMLGEAYKAVERPAMLIPSLGGGETWARYNLLYRKIQQEMLDLGMDQMKGKEVADLERRSLTKEEREKAAAKQRELEGADDLAAADRATARPSRSPKRRRRPPSRRPSRPRPTRGQAGWRRSPESWCWSSPAGAYFYFAGGKKKKRRPVVVENEPDFNFTEPQPPPAKVKRYKSATESNDGLRSQLII